MIDVSIVIVNYNTRELLKNCLQSIYQMTADISFEIIVVDNASSDDSLLMLESLYPEVICIISPSNIGFGKANNLGVKNANGEFLLLLNSDTLLIENSVFKLHNFFVRKETELSLAVLGCKLINVEGTVMNSGGGFPRVKNDINEYYYLIAEKLFFKKIKPRDIYDFNKPFFEIDYVIGADMFMRKSLFLDVNGFDPKFFMYYEESDLQYHIRKLGFKIYVTTDTQIIHLEGGSTNMVRYSPFKRLINQVSRNYYFKKNDRKYYPAYIIVDMILNITRIFNRKYTFKDNLNFIINNIKSY